MSLPNPAKGNPAHPDFPHGTRTGYQYGCRDDCPSDELTCLEAAMAYQEDYRRRNGIRPRGCNPRIPHRCTKPEHAAQNREYQRQWQQMRREGLV